MMIFTKKKVNFDSDDSEQETRSHFSHTSSHKKKSKGKKNTSKVKSSGFSLLPFLGNDVKDKKNKKDKNGKGKKKKKVQKHLQDDLQPEVRIISAPMDEKLNKKLNAMKRFHRFSIATIGPGKMFNTQSDKHRNDHDVSYKGMDGDDDELQLSTNNEDYGCIRGNRYDQDENSYNNYDEDQDTHSTGESMLSATPERRQKDSRLKYNVDSLIGNIVINRRQSNQTTKASNRMVEEVPSANNSFACGSNMRNSQEKKGSNISIPSSPGSPKDRTKPGSSNNNNSSNADAKLKAKAKALKKRVFVAHDTWFRFLCQSKHFCQFSDSVFDIVDHYETGVIDESELYQCLLLIHLKLGVFLGPAACRPISRQQCHAVFQKMDRENTGVLDKIEFREVIMLFFGNIIFRVLVQWCITIAIVPLIAQNFTRSFVWIMSLLFGAVAFMSGSSTSVGDSLMQQELLESNQSSFVKVIVYGYKAITYVIPEKIRQRTPLVLSSTLLGTIIIPVLIYQIDSMFQKMADSRSKKQPLNHKY